MGVGLNENRILRTQTVEILNNTHPLGLALRSQSSLFH